MQVLNNVVSASIIGVIKSIKEVTEVIRSVIQIYKSIRGKKGVVFKIIGKEKRVEKESKNRKR